MRTLQRLSAAAAALAAGALIATSMAAPAQAAASKDKPVDITKVIVKDVVIKKSTKVQRISGLGKRCFNVPMSLKYTEYKKNAHLDWIGAVAMGNRYAAEPEFVYLAPAMAGSKTLATTGASAFVCDRAGRIDFAVVGSTDFNFKNEFTNPTKVTGSFKIRQDAATTLTAKRSGKTVTLTAKATYFSVKTGKTTAYNPKGATVQVKQGSKWVKVNKKVTFKKGTAVVKVSQKAKKSYRITFKATSTVIGKTSKTVTK
ncbi:hypothetical protein DWB68_05775 [Galactobacter valiniphilus]|uniref:Uncharacterized protein n=1 Tax=Galactobacter valiniphilus TaxID=2676122 RepID=A0A399JBQ3_9MICC|nr:hypothetical protein [Galactobacter valiniphilus]RII42654.1 hypothetical protein DWB68_05775 [Galactobacter valiniphilus]